MTAAVYSEGPRSQTGFGAALGGTDDSADTTGSRRRHGCGMGRRGGLFRSGWEIAAMVIGFVIFFPLGLAVLGYLFWRKWKTNADGGSATMTNPFEAMGFKRPWAPASSGNSAFDAYREDVMERLRAQMRQLEQDQMAFKIFMERLKRAKDQEEFDRFMRDRAASADAGPAQPGPSGPEAPATDPRNGPAPSL